MRVLFVTQVAVDRPEGSARHVVALVRELAALGHRVALIAPSEGALDGSVLGGAEHVWLPTRFGGLRLGPGARMEVALGALAAKSVVSFRPDVAYVRISASTSIGVGALAALKVPIVLELNGPVFEEQERRGASPIKIEAARRLLRRAVGASRAVVVPLGVLVPYAREELGAPEVVLIENGADLEAVVSSSLRFVDRAAARRALGLEETRRWIGMVGSLGAEIRTDLVAEALRVLFADPELGLLVVGDGERSGPLEALAGALGDRVVMLGRRSHEEAVRAEQASEVLINARDGSCLGMKSLEYAAVGRRQVVFDTDGVARISALYPELAAVHVVRDRTVEGMGAAVRAALEAERRLGALPSPAVEAARKELGWDRTAREVAALLKRVAVGRT